MHKIKGKYACIMKLFTYSDLPTYSVYLSPVFTDIIHTCVDHTINSHFSAFSNLLRAAKDPIEDFLEEQFQKSEEKIRSQFKMEKIVYSQDGLYSCQLDATKKKIFQSHFALLLSADVREMAQHLTAYFMVIVC